MNVLSLEGTVLIVVTLALLAVKLFAFVTSLMYSPEHYRAADKLTKPTWTIILGLGAAAHVLMPGSPLHLINLAATIAAFVYLADVRPALTGLRQR